MTALLIYTSCDSNQCEEEGTAEEVVIGDHDGANEGDGIDFFTVGDFIVPVGWVVIDAPAADEVAWSSLKKNFKWQNKKLAHIWSEPTGWQLASFTN